MLIGVAREVKEQEYRVGLTPASVREIVAQGHEVLVEAGAGAGIGATDADYAAAGARRGPDRRAGVRAGRDDRQGEGAAGGRAPAAAARARSSSPTCTSRPIPEQARDLIASGAVCIAYETVTAPGGGLPLLAPMSRGRRAHGDPGGRALPGEAAGRHGHPAGRRARRAAGEGRGDRRRRGRATTPRRSRSGMRRPRGGPRPQPRQAARASTSSSARASYGLLQQRHHRAAGACRRTW